MKKKQNIYIYLVVGVFALGFLLRLFALRNTYFINPDGVLYIHQARALYYGEWAKLFSCNLNFLSNYPFLIAGAFPIVGDWRLSAQYVSFFFGFGMLVPIYFLFRRYFDTRVTLLGTLIFAMIPNFIDKSADALRDPVAWFFAAIGFLLFVMQHERRGRLWILLSSLSFLMAAWARIEFILLLAASGAFIIFTKTPGKWGRLVIFLSPVLCITALSLAGLWFGNVSMDDLYRTDELLHRLINPFREYRDLRNQLAVAESAAPDGLIRFFLPEAGTYAWLVALAALFSGAFATYFYPYFLIFILGFWRLSSRLQTNRWGLYFLPIVVAAFILLYVHILQTWMTANRFLALAILPSFIFFGFGLENIFQFFRTRLRWSNKAVMMALCAIIMVSALPKCLQSRETDKDVYREIAAVITERERPGHFVQIAGVDSLVIRWVRFLVNETYPGAPCPSFTPVPCEDINQMVREMKENGVRYLFWEEKAWPNRTDNFLAHFTGNDLVVLGRWQHPDTGRIILFTLKEDA